MFVQEPLANSRLETKRSRSRSISTHLVDSWCMLCQSYMCTFKLIWANGPTASRWTVRKREEVEWKKSLLAFPRDLAVVPFMKTEKPLKNESRRVLQRWNRFECSLGFDMFQNNAATFLHVCFHYENHGYGTPWLFVPSICLLGLRGSQARFFE